jgi:two-component system chemotaxis response regulator CheY
LARKILLADDSVTAQNMGRKILADAGYEVITVNNGSAALKKIAELKPEIIILDVYMPGYSGLEVCQRLKEAQETSRIPVMLTVGKLEPFKPEEAKRVRAEGYIVKPFEASELLSALSKLEDKIVPRGEASKPGRFARANAALDEGRYDKSVAMEEDSGWKNRIGFPSKKKKDAKEESDDSSFYNAVNKDLRTVVDRPPVAPANESKGEASRVDLGALAPEGLPKDVTPEEIAALAAAAAQVKGKLTEPVVENLPELPAEILPGAKAAEVPVADLNSDAKAEAKVDPAPVVEVPKESEVPAATFAAQKSDELAAKPADAVKATVAVPSAAEMMAAIAGLVPESGKPADSSSGNGSGAHTTSAHHASDHHASDQRKEDRAAVERSADEPVTMAAAAGAGSTSVASRWTAVAVALAPEESAISLEHEMQKAHAAFAAAEATPVAVAAPTLASAAAEIAAAREISSPVEAAEPVAPAVLEAAIAQTEVATAEVAQAEVAPSASPVSSPSPEVVAAAVREFERVAASFESRSQAHAPAQEPEAASAQVVEPVSQPSHDVPAVVEPASESVVTAVSEQESAQSEVIESAKEPVPVPVLEARKVEETEHEVPQYEEPKHEEAKPQEAQLEEAPEVAASVAPVADEATAPASEKLESASPIPEKETSAEAIVASPASHATEPVSPVEPGAGGHKDIAKKESEIAETTAAAWASWRRIRESGDAKGSTSSGKPSQSRDEMGAAHESSAMAVAAGAEKSPDEAAPSSEESPEIASIVDSVLAGMRPKIVEEISRKLGKK